VCVHSWNGFEKHAGRVSCRKGWTIKTTSFADEGDFDLGSMHAFEDGTNTVIISAGNNKLFYGTTTIADITGAITTPTASNWQFASWVKADDTTHVVGFQTGHTPIISAVSGGVPGNFANMTGTGLPKGNCVFVGFGRILASDSNNLSVNSCAIQDESAWNTGNFSFETGSYWPRGNDAITAISSWEDKLIVFGRENILIYDNPDVTASFALVDVITGIGCVSRDSVQHIGDDILFLSETGLRSLKRSVEIGNTPLQEIGNQVRNELVPYINGNESNIKSVYNRKEGFYLLVINDTSTPIQFMFDFKSAKTRDAIGRTVFDPDQVRVSTWEGWKATSMAYGWDEARNVTISYLNGIYFKAEVK